MVILNSYVKLPEGTLGEGENNGTYQTIPSIPW